MIFIVISVLVPSRGWGFGKSGLISSTSLIYDIDIGKLVLVLQKVFMLVWLHLSVKFLLATIEFQNFSYALMYKVLKNGVEVKLQRNALSVLEHPTGNEEDDLDYDNSSSGSEIHEKDNDFCKLTTSSYYD